MKQGELFGILQRLPAGLVYEPDFITRDEEGALLTETCNLPLREAKYKDYTAKRRIMSYGASYDFSSNELIPAGPIPAFLHALRERIAAWVEIPASRFNHALIAEYKTGTQLGWHRDVPEFEVIVGVSLGGPCRMRLRRYPSKKGRSAETPSLDLEPRSAYLMRGEARWGWQHSIPPTKTTRYSITFRTQS
ncbi:MAG TPA: alpha-ketoglutarate-dependent dioxygenase AlkB [Terriglobia bacterium]|nr:alpha-ketoglutarate-dependent dioxygenase AlkB [Terriglobia bacterium]